MQGSSFVHLLFHYTQYFIIVFCEQNRGSLIHYAQVIKGKPTPESKKVLESSVDWSKEKSVESVGNNSSSSSSNNNLTIKTETQKSTPESSPATTTSKSAESKQKKSEEKQQPITETKTTPANVKGKETPGKRSVIGLKKDTPITKRKLAVKNMIRQKKLKESKTKESKTKESSPESSSSSESSTANSSPPPKDKKKVVSEIDRLLQDEGVVNMLYDAEQPNSRRRVPITKSQKKVMDIDKAERELKFRTKLVKNAVLRLRNSGSPTTKVSPRSRRNVAAVVSAAVVSAAEQTIIQEQQQQTEKKSNTSDSRKSTESLNFILPTKIRNAADASRIIRRHSSSSFSSTSASPRVSIDQPPDSFTLEEPESPTKSKKKLSNESIDKSDVKKSSKKKLKSDNNETVKDTEKSPAKKESVKKTTAKSNVSTPPPPQGTGNAAVTGSKASGNKSKKVTKNKTSIESSPIDSKSTSKDEENLSACLAEVATALQTNNNGRKKKNTNVIVDKTSEDEKKIDTKSRFSNKEISVKYHGHLVQLILTPSLPVSGIRNSLTIQAMNEFQEVLSILKKDDDCRVVLFTSTGTSFCEGLELSFLLQTNTEERKTCAKKMAGAVK